MAIDQSTPFHVIIVGAGLGGIACAIACRQHGLRVTLLERTEKLQQVGAGIQVPPNGMRIMKSFGLEQKLLDAGAVVMQNQTMRRWEDGKVLASKPLGTRVEEKYGAKFIVIHRADYQDVLLDKALELGVDLATGADVLSVDTEAPSVTVRDGRVFEGDVVIGADGLWSVMRNAVLGKTSDPHDSGDLAYRGTFTLEQIQAMGNASLLEVIKKDDVAVWAGPDVHAVFYPVKHSKEFNLVLCVPDDLPTGTHTKAGTVEEMRSIFQGWDPSLNAMVSCMKSALKWKICHHNDLQTWSNGYVALMGDSCHPTLPYQGMGAAMAVEDGAVLGFLLGKLAESTAKDQNLRREKLPHVLKVYEEIRKDRTSDKVRKAFEYREFYHLPDGEQQRERDELLRQADGVGYKDKCKWSWADRDYEKVLLGIDVLEEASTKSEL